IVLPDLEVKIARLCLFRLAHPCNRLSSPDAVANRHRGRLEVSVERNDAIAVIKNDQVTVSLEPLRKQNCSSKYGAYFRPRRGSTILRASPRLCGLIASCACLSARSRTSSWKREIARASRDARYVSIETPCRGSRRSSMDSSRRA